MNAGFQRVNLIRYKLQYWLTFIGSFVFYMILIILIQLIVSLNERHYNMSINTGEKEVSIYFLFVIISSFFVHNYFLRPFVLLSLSLKY